MFTEASFDMKRAALKAMAAMAVCLVAAAGISPLTLIDGDSGGAAPTVLAFGCPQPLALQNSGFESPEITTDFAFVPDDQVPGWSTTATGGMFEFWKSGYQGVPSPQGNQFVELNAQAAGTVYQAVDTSTLQGQTLTYSFWHRGRVGNDTMAIQIGDANASQPNYEQQYTTGRSWVQYSGSYQVPVGQETTVFAYVAVTGTTVGNFLDDVQFGTPACTTDLAVTKTAGSDVYVPGEPVTYTIEITNTGQFEGQFDLVGATLTDAVPADVTDVTWMCTASARSACDTQSGSGNQIELGYDILEGGTVTVEVTGTAPTESPPPELTNSATVSVPEGVTDLDPSNNTSAASIPIGDAAIDLTKSSDYSTNPPVQGDEVTYTFVVGNTGTLPLTDVTITDPLEGLSPIDCDGDEVVAALAPGESATCTATYVITQEDVDAGSIENTATATATSPPDVAPPTPAESSATTPFEPDPAIAIEKTADTAGPVVAGDVITYSFDVANTGNVTLSDVTVDDPMPGLSPIDCDGDAVVASLAPGASVTCTASYTVTQDDVDAGAVDNTGTATGSPPGGPALPPVTDSVSRPADRTASLTFDKAADPTGDVVAGDVITYSFVVANTGTVTVSDVTVDDPLPGLSPIDCDGDAVVASLAPGASVTCTASYTVTQDDMNHGGVSNTATVTASAPDGVDPPDPVAETLVVPADADPSISVTKSADAEGPLSPGDVITYTFEVANTSNVTLSDITVTDLLAGLSPVDCGDGTNTIASLAVDDVVPCTATYSVTQQDVDAGGITNSATVVGHLPNGDPVADDDFTTTPTSGEPALSLAKAHSGIDDIDGNGVDAGDTITYTFVVGNTGDVTLTSTTVDDPLLGGPVPCDGGQLDPGASRSCTAAYALTDDDLDTTIENTATATGTTGSGATVQATDTATLTIPPACSDVDASRAADAETAATSTSAPSTTVPTPETTSAADSSVPASTVPVTTGSSEPPVTATVPPTIGSTAPVTIDSTVPVTTIDSSIPGSTAPATIDSTVPAATSGLPASIAPVRFAGSSTLQAVPRLDPCAPPPSSTVVPPSTQQPPATTSPPVTSPPPPPATVPPPGPTSPPTPTAPTLPTSPVQPPVTGPDGGASLPETGTATIVIVLVALLMIGGGVGLVLVGRRDTE